MYGIRRYWSCDIKRRINHKQGRACLCLPCSLWIMHHLPKEENFNADPTPPGSDDPLLPYVPL